MVGSRDPRCLPLAPAATTRLPCSACCSRPAPSCLLVGCAAAPTPRSADAPPPRATETATGTVILVSFDGFRWDYPELHGAPTVRRLAAEGVRANGLIPIFPTKTFPNHYSIVTGLYAEHHGIVGNNMWDPVWDATFSLRNREEVANGRWWEGEPIWVTAEKQGVRSAAYFWPGAEAEIGGVRPTYWEPFDDSVPGEARVDKVLGWLDLPADERPAFITLYFSDVDSAGHRHGPEARETRSAVRRVDAYLARLVSGLEERGLYDSTHILLVSDHGMTQMDPEKVIVLEDYLDMDAVRVVDLSVIAMLRRRDGDAEALYAALEGSHPQLRVARRDELPARFHFAAHRRIPEIVAWAAPGWYIYATHSDRRLRSARFALGMHGSDNAERTQHALFVARGPRLRQGHEVPAFENVHLYELMAALLGIAPAPNDGDPELAASLLRPRE